MQEMVHGEVLKAIENANRRFVERYRKGDIAGVAELFTEDAVMMPPNSDFVRGKTDIQKSFEWLFAAGVKDMELVIVEAEQCGHVVIVLSRYILFGAQNQVIDKGKYLGAWKQEQGDWKLYRDIQNSSLPAQ